jgi:hypothetical protein
VTVVFEPSLRDNPDIRFQAVKRASLVQRRRIVHWPISVWSVGNPLEDTPARLTSWCHYKTLNTTRSKTPQARCTILIDWFSGCSQPLIPYDLNRRRTSGTESIRGSSEWTIKVSGHPAFPRWDGPADEAFERPAGSSTGHWTAYSQNSAVRPRSYSRRYLCRWTSLNGGAVSSVKRVRSESYERPKGTIRP